MKTKLFLILLMVPLFGLSQKTYKGLVLQTDKYPGQVIMLKENGDTTHVWPPKLAIGNYAPTEIFSSRTDLIIQTWKQYLVDCNTLVPDTIKQDGTVNVKYKPVIVNGEVSHYLLTPIDTVWTKCKCEDYKNGLYIFSTGNVGIGWGSLNVSTTNSITYTPAEQINNKINITRNKICHIKKRKASWDDFWNRWLVEKKIIELN